MYRLKTQLVCENWGASAAALVPRIVEIVRGGETPSQHNYITDNNSQILDKRTNII